MASFEKHQFLPVDNKKRIVIKTEGFLILATIDIAVICRGDNVDAFRGIFKRIFVNDRDRRAIVIYWSIGGGRTL